MESQRPLSNGLTPSTQPLPNTFLEEASSGSYVSSTQSVQLQGRTSRPNRRSQRSIPTSQNHRPLRPMPRTPTVATTHPYPSRRAVQPQIASQAAPEVQAEEGRRGGGTRKSGRVRSLIRFIQENGACDPNSEMRLPVSVFSASSEKHAFNAVFSHRIERGFATASMVRFLGLCPMDLPPGADRTAFASPWGLICPKRFVRLVIEQRRNDLPLVPSNILVLDDGFPEHGIDLYLGQEFLAAVFNGKLPPKASNARNGQMNTVQPLNHAQSGWRNAMDFGRNGSANPSLLPPLTSVGILEEATSQAAADSGWSQQGGALLPEQIAYQNSVAFPMQSLPTPPVGSSLLQPMHTEPAVPSLPEEPLWNHENAPVPENIEWLIDPTLNPGFYGYDAGWPPSEGP